MIFFCATAAEKTLAISFLSRLLQSCPLGFIFFFYNNYDKTAQRGHESALRWHCSTQNSYQKSPVDENTNDAGTNGDSDWLVQPKRHTMRRVSPLKIREMNITGWSVFKKTNEKKKETGLLWTQTQQLLHLCTRSFTNISEWSLLEPPKTISKTIHSPFF